MDCLTRAVREEGVMSLYKGSENHGFCIDFVLKMKDFVLQMKNFLSKMMDLQRVAAELE